MDLQMPGDWNFTELLQQESNMNNEFMIESPQDEVYTQQSPPKVQMNPLLRRHNGVVISQ